MDIENKLDEDFLFYLGFTNNFSSKMQDCSDQALVNQWLQKLCGEPFNTVDLKWNRNIFLSNLLLNMQDGRLVEPYTLNPNEVDISDAKRWFPAIQQEITVPAWVNDVVEDSEDRAQRENGRTYVATRTMPGGEGSFAYVAISLSDDTEEQWLGGREGAFNAALEQKFKDVCPPPTEMELILARRKDTKERQRVLTFYDVLLQNISDELDGKITSAENNAINVVLDQLIADLKLKGQFEFYSHLDEKEKRIELLLILFDRTRARRNKVATREEILDQVEATLSPSFFHASGGEEAEKFELPTAMWEFVINRPPNKTHMEAMQTAYPPFVVEKFMELLSNEKEEVAMRMQRRHNNIVSQMKKELKKEGERLRKWVDVAKREFDKVMEIYKICKDYAAKQKASEDRAKNRKKGGETEMTKLYEEMRSTIFDTQKDVEDEAERGRILSSQINTLNAQTEVYNQINECTIIKAEEANMEIMKNIKRLRVAVTQFESRLQQMQIMNQTRTSSKASQMAFIV